MSADFLFRHQLIYTTTIKRKMCPIRVRIVQLLKKLFLNFMYLLTVCTNIII